MNKRVTQVCTWCNNSFQQKLEMAVFISKVEELQCQLKQLGEEISDSQVISKILNSLPSKYSHFHSAWDSTYQKEQTLDNLTHRLLSEERRIKATNSEEEIVALAVKRESFREIVLSVVNQVIPSNTVGVVKRQ